MTGLVADEASHGVVATRPHLGAGYRRSDFGGEGVALTLQRDLEGIERELDREFRDEDDERLAQRRKTLETQFRSLDAPQSWELLTRVLQPVEADNLADRFQRLSRGPRADLLHVLFGRLDHLEAEGLAGSLKGAKGNDVDKRLRSRFRDLIPESGQRTRLIGVLDSRFSASHQRVPGKPVWIRLTFKNAGALSTDNMCQLRADIKQLGVDWNDGKNAMEIRGDVAGSAQGVQFDFKRTRETASWQKHPTDWQTGLSWAAVRYDPAGTNDDTQGNADEDLIPDHGHIYVVDRPGSNVGSDPGWPLDKKAPGGYYVSSFVEWVEAKVGTGPWKKVSDELEWHSKTTLENVKGSWQRDKDGENEIAPGPVQVVSPDGQTP